MGKEIVLRYTLAVLLGCVCVSVMASSFHTSFDKVASTSLFSCIISVTNEDESLGPVIKKGMNRFGGACVGGFCGYLCILLRDELSFLSHPVLLVLIPCVFVTILQIIVESEHISKNYISKYKMKHFVIQLQVALGVVYIGDTVDVDEDSNSLMIAIARTSAILVGVVCLLLASLLAFPETSMQATTTSLSDSLLALGKLSERIIRHRIEGRSLPRYDHRQYLFALNPVMDDQAGLLESVDRKLTRVKTLLPHLSFEPLWVPGLPLRLLPAQREMSPHWVPFVTVLASRLKRVRSSLSAMDSNMRISSDEADKELSETIAQKMTELIENVKEALTLVATYLKSPYQHREHLRNSNHCSALWKGDLSIKDQLIDSHIKVQTSIEEFAIAFEESILQNNMMLPGGNREETSDSAPQTYAEADLTHNKFMINSYTLSKTASHRARLGKTLDYYFRTGPRRTFCNLCIQVSIQTTSVIMEAVDFMTSLDHDHAKDSKNQQEQLESHSSEQEVPYKPIRSKSGLRLAELEMLKHELGDDFDEKSLEEVLSESDISSAGQCDDILPLKEDQNCIDNSSI